LNVFRYLARFALAELGKMVAIAFGAVALRRWHRNVDHFGFDLVSGAPSPFFRSA
jgi:hypothetical protein